ncbi:MAG: hypothetical protein KGQ49_00670 [Verrucomicrobia bacterium]|nr:hypothetical protein [Verrucomicrobiota bacterium]MBU6445894.1 hypothetical protein [Verrucomicrobiota bacterium]MDE3046729.1 hypothetical protein [Verrucomicrobiota bacterium]
MNPKRIQLLFLLGTLAITLHFTCCFGWALFHYLSMSQTAPAHVKQWEIIPIKKQFAIQALFTIQTQEKDWQNSFTFPPPYYPNEWAALSELKIMAKKGWTAHYKYPNQALLQNEFPLNLCIRTMICFGVLGYFFILNRKVNRNFLSSK